MHFDADWSETWTLRAGQRVEFRLLRAEDREELRRAFERLSPESRYRRFFTPMDRLTERQLDYFTHVDQQDHVAIAAVLDGQGVGLGRFVRIGPRVAEPALAVADDLQGQGVGTQLMVRLCQAARERGIETFHVEFLADNEAVLTLLEGVSQHTLDTVLDEDGVYRGEFPIPEWHMDREWDHPRWLDAVVEAAAQLRAVTRQVSLVMKSS